MGVGGKEKVNWATNPHPLNKSANSLPSWLVLQQCFIEPRS